MRFGAASLLAATFLASPAAHAQHVVTEAEASKLTLEALTAPPPPPRPAYRAYVHEAMSVRYVRIHGRRVRERVAPVSYRHSEGRHVERSHREAVHHVSHSAARHHRR